MVVASFYLYLLFLVYKQFVLLRARCHLSTILAIITATHVGLSIFGEMDKADVSVSSVAMCVVHTRR